MNLSIIIVQNLKKNSRSKPIWMILCTGCGETHVCNYILICFKPKFSPPVNIQTSHTSILYTSWKVTRWSFYHHFEITPYFHAKKKTKKKTKQKTTFKSWVFAFFHEASHLRNVFGSMLISSITYILINLKLVNHQMTTDVFHTVHISSLTSHLLFFQ